VGGIGERASWGGWQPQDSATPGVPIESTASSARNVRNHQRDLCGSLQDTASGEANTVLTFSLNSGSNGNSIYVEADGQGLLFDAGISGVEVVRRFRTHKREPHHINAIFVSHEHQDHIRCAGVYHRKFKVPLYITQKTLAATWCDLGLLGDVRFFESGSTVELGRVRVHTIRTAHDAADGVSFVVECEGKRLGIFTDLGHPFPDLLRVLAEVDAAYLETNFDPEMLATGRYPHQLQQRIRGPHGHLSNDEAADALRFCGKRLPKWIAVSHLSEDNNRPELAVACLRNAIGQEFIVHHASRYQASALFEV
jgi:phosphoribosyl 1,2-cyclic phosphodiesterase